MASKVFPPYTTSEAQNLALGQAGSFHLDDNTATTVSGCVIIAITFLADTKFTTLLSEDDNKGNDAWPNTAAAAKVDGSSVGDDVDSGTVFPAGVTIYGRWTGLTLVTGGKVIAYVGA